MRDTSLNKIEILAPRASLRPCILDHDPVRLGELLAAIVKMGYEPFPAGETKEALELVRRTRCGVVIAAVHIPEVDGYEFLDQALDADPEVHVILMAGKYTLESALGAIRRGAWDFLPVPVDFTRLRKALHEVTALYDQRHRVKAIEEQLLTDLDFQGIIARSPVMMEVFDLARKVAPHYTNVLLVGATGTGKELVARAIHQISPVGGQKLAVCNCSAMVDTLLESQLFGHVRGAFTGAIETRIGLFEYANGGTIFLDEVGETSLAMQSKLLRVIQNREIQRVGSPEVRHVDVRVIAATNRDLLAAVLAKTFREDLFYRLNSIQIRIPPLAERVEDIPMLTRFFLKKYNKAYGKNISGLTRRAQLVLLRHAWPGNVRELENLISSACITATGDFIDIIDLPGHLLNHRDSSLEGAVWKHLTLKEVCTLHVVRVLEMCQGDRSQSSQILGIGRTTLYRYLRQIRQAAEPQEKSKRATA
jgi:DNA-binding NtrC family response regulator